MSQYNGFVPGLIMSRVMQRFQQPQGAVAPNGVEMVPMVPDTSAMGFVPQFGANGNAYQFHQAMQAQRHAAMRDAFLNNNGLSVGGEFGADAFGAHIANYEAEDEDEFGYDAEQELLEAEYDEFNGPGRLRRILGRTQKKKGKWNDRASRQSGLWAMGPLKSIAGRKADKFSRKESDISQRLARKSAGMAAAGAAGAMVAGGSAGYGGYSYVNNDAPPLAGQQNRVLLYPKAGGATGWVVNTSYPVVTGTIPAGATETAELTLESKPIQYAQHVLTGIGFSPKQVSNGAVVLGNDLKVGGQGGLFATDEWQDLDLYDVNLEVRPGLRSQAIIKENNQITVKVRLYGAAADTATFSLAAIVDILQDQVPSARQMVNRPAPPWAS